MLKMVDITKTQLDAVVQSQNEKNGAEKLYLEAARHLETVTSLVLDAHGIDPTIKQFQVDVQKMQLVVEVPDELFGLEKLHEPASLENEIG